MILKKEAIAHINSSLHLPYTGTEQDWDIEMANPDRVGEFIAYYQTASLSADEKMALMALILASYEDLLNEQQVHQDEQWPKIEAILKQEKKLYPELLSYWDVQGDMPDDQFKITPLIRGLK
jgi:hypothetical protein